VEHYHVPAAEGLPTLLCLWPHSKALDSPLYTECFFSGSYSICCGVTASEFAGVLPERMFSSLTGGMVIFQLILDLLSIRKPHWGVLQRQNSPGKVFCQPLSEKVVQTLPSSFGQQLSAPFLCSFESEPHRETLYIYTVQVLSL